MLCINFFLVVRTPHADIVPFWSFKESGAEDRPTVLEHCDLRVRQLSDCKTEERRCCFDKYRPGLRIKQRQLGRGEAEMAVNAWASLINRDRSTADQPTSSLDSRRDNSAESASSLTKLSHATKLPANEKHSETGCAKPACETCRLAAYLAF